MSRLRPLLRWVPAASLAAGVALFLFHLPELADGDWSRLGSSALDQAWPLLIVLVAAYGLRGTSSLQILGAVLTGFFTAFWISQVGGDFATEIMGTDGTGRLTVVVPIIEEVSKLLPLAVLVWFWWRRGGSPGALDLGLFGMAAGAGFAFHEDALWGRLSGSGFDGIGWLFPSVHSDAGLVAGHLVWTAFVGLALGIALSRRNRLWRLLPLGALLFVIVDHGTWNSPELRESLGWVTANGWIPVLGALTGIVAAFWLDVRRVRDNTPEDRLLRREVLQFIAFDGGTHGVYAGSGRLRRWLDGNWLLRLQAQLSYQRRSARSPQEVSAG